MPNACGPKDGWKTNAALTSQKFATKGDAIPPGCVSRARALGIGQAQVQDKTAKLKGGKFKVKGKNGTYAPAVGPLRMTVVLGGAARGRGRSVRAPHLPGTELRHHRRGQADQVQVAAA